MFSMVFVMVTMAAESARANRGSVKRGQYADKSCRPGGRKWQDGSIDFDHVSFKYSLQAEKMALADIDLHIRSGEIDWNYRWHRFFEVFPDPTDFQTL